MKAERARENPNLQPQHSCEGISPLEEPCSQAATIFCDKCARWFCSAHLPDESWHACQLGPGEEGGEG